MNECKKSSNGLSEKEENSKENSKENSSQEINSDLDQEKNNNNKEEDDDNDNEDEDEDDKNVNQNEDDSNLKNLISNGIDSRIAQRLNSLFLSHKLSFNDLDDRTIQALKEYGALEETLSVLDELKESNDENLPNKLAFLSTLMKKIRAKEKTEDFLDNSVSGTNHASASLSSSSSSKHEHSVSNDHTHSAPNADKLKAILDRTGNNKFLFFSFYLVFFSLLQLLHDFACFT